MTPSVLPSAAPGFVSRQRGVSLFGLLFWAVLLGASALLAMKVFPSVNEYLTIQRSINKIATNNAASPADVRNAFERQKDVEYSITSISGKDLEITKENERVVIKFAYEKEIALIPPVFLLIKYEGRSQ